MDLGRSIITAALTIPGALAQFTEEGLDLAWLTGKEDLSRGAIFGKNDVDAYQFILRRYAETGEAPSLAYFQKSYPPQSLGARQFCT